MAKVNVSIWTQVSEVPGGCHRTALAGKVLSRESLLVPFESCFRIKPGLHVSTFLGKWAYHLRNVFKRPSMISEGASPRKHCRKQFYCVVGEKFGQKRMCSVNFQGSISQLPPQARCLTSH